MVSWRFAIVFLTSFTPTTSLAQEENDALRLVLLQSKASVVDAGDVGQLALTEGSADASLGSSKQRHFSEDSQAPSEEDFSDLTESDLPNASFYKVPGEPVRPALPYGTPQRRLLEETQGDRLPSVLPVAWVHVPKCGSSFGNVLIDMPGMCENIPERVTINKEEYGENELGEFKRRWDVLHTGCGKDKFAKWGNHAGMGQEERHSTGAAPSPRDFLFRPNQRFTEDVYSTMYKGHAMGFFRQPEQRIISGYHHNYHDFHRPPYAQVRPTMHQYRKGVAGCAVKMLTRQGRGEVCGSEAPTQREVMRAVVRLREAFVFVGITDKWQGSICTFKAMFGGRCHRSDFGDIRVGTKAPSSGYDLEKEGLKNWHDQFDGVLYREALRVWRAQMELFNVTRQSCEPCLREAGIEYDPSEW